MQIILKIKNINPHRVMMNLLGAMRAPMSDNCGLPKGITIEGFIDDGDIRGLKYRDLLNQTCVDPMLINVDSSTNNRQLDFSYGGIDGRIQMLEPSLTIKKKPRPEHKVWDGFGWSYEYKTAWKPKVWNIADTQEEFICDGKEIIDLKIEPNQLFEIVLNVTKRVRTIDRLTAMVVVGKKQLKIKGDVRKKK